MSVNTTETTTSQTLEAIRARLNNSRVAHEGRGEAIKHYSTAQQLPVPMAETPSYSNARSPGALSENARQAVQEIMANLGLYQRDASTASTPAGNMRYTVASVHASGWHSSPSTKESNGSGQSVA